MRMGGGNDRRGDEGMGEKRRVAGRKEGVFKSKVLI